VLTVDDYVRTCDSRSTVTRPNQTRAARAADDVAQAAAMASTMSAEPALRLRPGELFAERFLIEHLAGSGGMAMVYRAIDRKTDARVALKLLRGFRDNSTHDHVERFAREATVLAALSHPRIVQYQAHGRTASGEIFLAMEWLEGVDLSQRLLHSRLSVADSLSVLRCACEGAAAAHAVGVVHRDIKPSNLFLLGSSPATVKLLDFGIARLQRELSTLTQSGVTLGTVGYMSPEQAVGAHAVEPCSDVFALGCVLFECLTGHAAFSGANAVAVLAKVLSEEPLLPSEFCPDVPPALDSLVAGMLTKDARRRIPDAPAVLDAIDKLQATLSLPCRVVPAARLSAAEQRVVSVILSQTRTTHISSADIDVALELGSRFGGQTTALRGGAALVLFSGHGAPTDQAAQAIRCALHLQRAAPHLRLGVATGRADTTGRFPMGVAIDRAAQLLMTPTEPSSGIPVDELTAALLDPSFLVLRAGLHTAVLEERNERFSERLVLGKPTAFVGREKELGLLKLTMRECLADSVARAVLITGPPGQGKSRLSHEFLRAVDAQAVMRTLRARGDMIGAGSPFLLVRQLILDVIGRPAGNPVDVLQRDLQAHCAALGARCEQVTCDFLLELIGTPSAGEPSPQLRAARNDPQIMSIWLQRSLSAWLDLLCQDQPILIVLEDLHWGDGASVVLLGEALRALKHRPLLIVALARSEIAQTFPSLWSSADLQHVTLGRLTQRAAEQLVLGVLDAQIAEEHVGRIVRWADGNPFYLEELMRCAADSGESALPESVLALVQSRLERLEPHARRVARAASLFGERCWSGGLAAVLGTHLGSAELQRSLHELHERELIIRSPSSRFAGEFEYEFLHSLVHDAAYSMLTEADCCIGHVLAGDWLERAGERDALRLVEHFERGGEHARAIGWLIRAAQAEADGGNFERVVSLARRGMAGGVAQGAELGLLLLLHAEALGMAGQWHAADRTSREALGHFPAGSSGWFRSAASILAAASFLGEPTAAADVLKQVLALGVKPDYSGAFGYAICVAIQGLCQLGQEGTAESILAHTATGQPSQVDPVFSAWLENAAANIALTRGSLAPALENAGGTRARRVGARLAWLMGDLYRVMALCQTGHLERAAQAVHTLTQECEPLSIRTMADWANFFLIWARANVDETSDAEPALESLLTRDDEFLVVSAQCALAVALASRGAKDQALQHAHIVAALPARLLQRSSTMGSLAWVELRVGDPNRALTFAERGLELLDHWDFPLGTLRLRLSHAEALHALGRRDDAKRAIRSACDAMSRVAATLIDPELRDAFCARIKLSVRTRELAAEWLGQ
jgi:tRNA A-37 threonylcarbamoyl transferase component Bud32